MNVRAEQRAEQRARSEHMRARQEQMREIYFYTHCDFLDILIKVRRKTLKFCYLLTLSYYKSTRRVPVFIEAYSPYRPVYYSDRALPNRTTGHRIRDNGQTYR